MRHLNISFVLLATTLIFACAKKDEPAVRNVRIEPSTVIAGESVTATVQLNKSALLSQEFLYGASLQDSVIFEDGESEDILAIALGHIPVKFQIFQNKLRILSDEKINFESDMNHPEKLIHEFPIVSQDNNTITITVDSGSPVLDMFLLGQEQESPFRKSWIRSAEAAENGNLLMIESSVLLFNGTNAKFLETLMPKKRLISNEQDPIFDDADLEPLAENFGFIDAGKVWVDHKEEGRVETRVASRFSWNKKDPILWYVTSNIQDEYLNDVKNGIEGWNRYSQKMWGVDIVKFAGKAPEGTKIGDPRFNIVVWDNIQDAGAAYESQGAEPTTGIQSHSLIYLPYAWINIGKEFWKQAENSEGLLEDKAFLKKQKFLNGKKAFGRHLPVNCLQSALPLVSLSSRKDPELFARSLLKGVLFHEVGHALGLGHNFKGSLSFDSEDSSKPFTNSIMDYNNYNEEDAAFTSLDSSAGPIFEYDRQALSVLYNNAEDIKDSDPSLPYCSDEQANSTSGGVDPLCVRYDIGSDPTKEAIKTLKLFQEKDSKYGKMHSYYLAMKSAFQTIENSSEIKDEKALKKALSSALGTVRGTISFYLSGLGSVTMQSMKTIYVFRDDVLLEGQNENEMRDRSLDFISLLWSLSELPENAKQGLNEVELSLVNWIEATPYFSSLTPEKAEALKQSMIKSWKTTIDNHVKSLMSRVRMRAMSSINYSSTAPISFHKKDGKVLDLESMMIELLANSISPKFYDLDRPITERAQAIKSLSTFKKVPFAIELAKKTSEELKLEIQNATDARKREELRALWTALQW
ncbi:MAG: zinc-dependent metalloprotease [Oligoflexia bacterium]|nr:zinc-dependent metalloprotease [Oligoflexia bacterium]